jgi:hypothetical protein
MNFPNPSNGGDAMVDADMIAAGRSLAHEILSKTDQGGFSAANQFRASMSIEDRAALSAFRDHELMTIVGQVEDSETGAAIRWEAAKTAYAALVSKSITAVLEGK